MERQQLRKACCLRIVAEWASVFGYRHTGNRVSVGTVIPRGRIIAVIASS